MNKLVFSFLVLSLMFSSFFALAQEGEASTEEFYLELPKQSSKFIADLPPILTIDSYSFSEQILDANDSAALSITIRNVGPGVARDVYIKLSGTYQNGLSFPYVSPSLPITSNGGTQTITIDIVGEEELETGEAELKIEIVEPIFKVRIQGKKLKFPTRELPKPKLILARYAISENNSAKRNSQVDINEIIDLKIAIQNIGHGNAENVEVRIKNDQLGVMLLGVDTGDGLIRKDKIFTQIKSGAYETITYQYFVNSEFVADELVYSIVAKESFSKYGFNETNSFPINKKLEETGYIRNISKEDDLIVGTVTFENITEFSSDVDQNIPKNTIQKENAYALIIGNEDYKSRQTDLNSEQNVEFAENDAIIFSLYCERTLGIPLSHIKLLKNATKAEIQRGLAWINNLAKVENGNAEIVFYYSGHGLPDEQTREAYLIPVDVSGNQLEYALQLSDVFSMLSEHPATRITAFIDACFSGGARNESLLARKGMRIKPKENPIRNNMVIFSSSSGNESSGIYLEKQHGYFTYYLLKKLKDTRGNTTYNELADYITQSIRKETALQGKIQTPEVKVSPEVIDVWGAWKIN